LKPLYDFELTLGITCRPSTILKPKACNENRQRFFLSGPSRLLGRLLRGSEQVPLTGDTLQDVSAAIDEADARAGDEVFDGAGYQHLTGLGGRSYTRSDVQSDSADLGARHFDLPSMQTSADLDTELVPSFNNIQSTSNRASRSIEGGEESITGGINLAASKSSELSPNHGVMPLEKLYPSTIAQTVSELCRADNVRKKQSREDAVRL
jgi:hypothetical protein